MRKARVLIVFLSEVIVSHCVKQGKSPHNIPIIYGMVGDFKGLVSSCNLLYEKNKEHFSSAEALFQEKLDK